MRKIISILVICIAFSCNNENVYPSFITSDKELYDAYSWACNMALSYAHNGGDSVGLWYEAALPQREAFCMRDVSHQTMGAEILGLSAHNYNMMEKFAQNISDEKDWCSYWEINRYNKPAPVDYQSDKEFWYNLNANFDVIFAAVKLYNWTGNKEYITNPAFMNFYEKSLKEYVDRWSLNPSQIMDRPVYMNSPMPFDYNNRFHTCRGLASYVENFPGLTMSADLISAMYAGNNAYAEILEIKGDAQKSEKFREIAKQYREILDSKWWDASQNKYHTFYTKDGEFATGEGETFILWFDATNNIERIIATANSIPQRNTNVENLSHFPVLYYGLDMPDIAYEVLTSLPNKPRNEYPEVSYGIVEGVVRGVMGIDVQVSKNSISTQHKHHIDTILIAINDLPAMGGKINVTHSSNKRSEFSSDLSEEVVWRAKFFGEYDSVSVNGEMKSTKKESNKLGDVVSYIDVITKPGEKNIVEVIL